MFDFRADWRRYVRNGMFLLVFVVFTPVFVAFSVGTISVLNGVPVGTDETMMLDMGREDMMAQDSMGYAPEMSMTAPMPADAPMMGKMWMGGGGVMGSDRDVTKYASLDVRTGDLDAYTGQVRDLAARVGGWIENSNVTQPEYGERMAWMTVRVPEDRLDATLAELKTMSSVVVNEHVNMSDITEQNVNVDARLESLRTEENALNGLLDRATNVGDIMQVTNRLAAIRSEIDQLNRERRSLETQEAMSTIHLGVTEDLRISANAHDLRHGNVLKGSVSELYRWLIALGSALAAIAITGVPVILVYGLIIWLVYKLTRAIVNRAFGRSVKKK